MTDTMMIRDCIRSQGMKLGHVAHVLGITNNTLRCKLENESEFKVSEAEKLSKMLGMTVEQRDRCFFGPAGCGKKGMEAMTQEQRKKTKEALSRCGQKNWVYGPCNWGWKRAIQLAEEYYREADPGLRGSILQLRYMERRRREEVMDKLNISYSTYQKAHDDLLSTIAVFAAHYGEL